MPDPTPYNPSYDFTASDKGAELNVQLADIAVATEGLVSAITDIRRSDGALQNGIVTADSLSLSALAALGPNGTLADAAVTSAASAAATATAQAALASTARGEAQTAATAAATSATGAAASATAAAAEAAAAAASATTASAQAAAAAASAAAASAARVAFVAHRDSIDQTGIATDTATKVALGTEGFDQGGHYDTALSRWTPPAGRYRLTAAALLSANVVDQSQFRAAIYKNGALLRQCVVTASGTAAVSALVSAIDEANGTDFYEFYVQGGGTGSKTISGAPANTWFEGSAV